MPLYAQVAVDTNVRSLDRLFTYIIPAELSSRIKTGTIVKIPFGTKYLAGFVIEILDTPPLLAGITLKEITDIIRDSSPWHLEMILTAKWMQDYYGCTFNEALRAVFPSSKRKIEKKKVSSDIYVTLKKSVESEDCSSLLANTPLQKELLEEFQHSAEKRILCRKTIPRSVLKALERKGFIELEYGRPIEIPYKKDSENMPVNFKLTNEQQEAAEKIVNASKSEKAEIFLLHGITGSGKTEVYLEAAKKVIEGGKNVIILMPEISLTPQYAERFKNKFADKVAILHSLLPPSQHNNEWERLSKGEAAIVLGTRSAIFAPFENIGMIVIDEEHENAYKQENSPRYNARQIAVRRARFHNSPLILASATPSLESYLRAKDGRYTLIELKERPSGKLPKIKLVDMRKSYSRTASPLLSPFLLKQIRARLDKQEQTLLFISRRGFFNYLYCPDCGYIFLCKHCDVALRFHKKPPVLLCHYCNYTLRPPDVCPKCASHQISSKGGGTQRLQEELETIFPSARILRLDRDSAPGVKTGTEIYEKFRSKEADILIGTQMIAKGLDFPGVTLSAVVLADALFSMPDFRASEKAFQLMVQVAGRAGRNSEESLFVIQTFNPDHPAVIAASRGDFRAFYFGELSARKELSYPPYFHMIRILVSSEDKEKMSSEAKRFVKLYEVDPNEFITGPSSCPVSKIGGKFRAQIFIRTAFVRRCCEKFNRIVLELSSKNVIFTIDVDSLSFL